MDQGYLTTQLNLLDSKLDQIIAILHQRMPIIRPSSYSQSLDCRGKEYKTSKKTGQIKSSNKP